LHISRGCLSTQGLVVSERGGGAGVPEAGRGGAARAHPDPHDGRTRGSHRSHCPLDTSSSSSPTGDHADRSAARTPGGGNDGRALGDGSDSTPGAALGLGSAGRIAAAASAVKPATLPLRSRRKPSLNQPTCCPAWLNTALSTTQPTWSASGVNSRP